MKNSVVLFIILISLVFPLEIFSAGFIIKGKITTDNGRKPVDYASILIENTLKGAQSDDEGFYQIDNVAPGFYKIRVSAVGYKNYTSFEFRISTSDFILNVDLEEENIQLNEVSVTANTNRRNAEAPLSLQVISLKQIEKIPGANRDISKVISSFAGVATPTVYRNDILVRGGGPSENSFYLDGVKIPNINHFATQGASGGPVGILNADLLREVDFYSGGFPVSRKNGVSSVLDFKLKDGSQDRKTAKFTLGASEAGISSNGPIGEKTTYQLSLRYSYLQFLFSVMDMAFLPRYIDGQFKIKTRINQNNEVYLIGIGAFDNMKLNDNVDQEDESKYQLFQTLPVYKQKTYTLGMVYKHYYGKSVQSVILSNSLLWNSAMKYVNNESNNSDMLRYKYLSEEGQTRLRFENSTRVNLFKIVAGAGIEHARYSNNTFNRNFNHGLSDNIKYDSKFDLFEWSVFASGAYESLNGKVTASAGFRFDANNYSDKMNNLQKQFAPRASFSYNFYGPLYLNMAAGRYYQLPNYTSMGYKNEDDEYANKNSLLYFRNDQFGGGFEFRKESSLKMNFDGFYKRYSHGALSLKNLIPIACLGSDYGVIGDEEVSSSSKGKAYGLEYSLKWNIGKRINLIASYTYVRSSYIDQRDSYSTASRSNSQNSNKFITSNKSNGNNVDSDKYISSSWDIRNLLTTTFLYSLPSNWDFGIKFRLMGGAPYTPYDLEASSLVESWDLIHKPVLDYSKFNSERLKTFTQIDIRIDKTYYWRNNMLGFYIDIQNVANNKYTLPPLLISTGKIENTSLPLNEQHYQMKWIKDTTGTILPTIGFTIEI